LGSSRRFAPASYDRFRRIDGRHPLKQAVPRGRVEYRARRRRGDVVFFNFELAREMGLIPRDHPDRLNSRLRRAIVATFALTIINEYDIERGKRFSEREVLPGTYIATRYLQLQHPGRHGKTSGDGRSIWNGCLTHRGVTWDITSCGTGVTRLCPATAEENRFFKTGNRLVSYGCGTATLEEGLTAALMSETFHKNGIATERVLAVILLDDGFAINVRAGRNLLRPSHFFVFLKQNDRESLQAAIDVYIDRQTANGDFPRLRGRRRYEHLAKETARIFGKLAATFEREYIFCWMDWDGDNILTDGGVIDYGSVRQFGLFHGEYRFDDGPRYSTSLTEQRKKARYIVQCFAQIRDLLTVGHKARLRTFSSDPILDIFDECFARTRDDLLLHAIGFDGPTCDALMKKGRPMVRRFDRAHGHFERARSTRGPVSSEDGVTWSAIFSTRDLLRELPRHLLREASPLPAERFIELGLSSYATKTDRKATPHRCRMALEFQRAYLALIGAAARTSGCSEPMMLSSVAWRSGIINRYARITGDSVIYAARKLLRWRKRLPPEVFYQVMRSFVDDQCLVPESAPARRRPPSDRADAKRILDDLIGILAEFRHGL